MNSSPVSEQNRELYEWASPVSLLIIRTLGVKGRMSVSELSLSVAKLLNLRNPYGTVHRYVGKLEQAGIVKSAYEKKKRLVSINANYLSNALLEISEALKFAEALRASGGMLTNAVLGFAERLREFSVPIELRFYGSFVRGTARPGLSDVDVLVIVPDGEKRVSAKNVREIAITIKSTVGGDIHPFVLSRSKLSRLVAEKSPVIMNALRDGITLYLHDEKTINRMNVRGDIR